MNSKIDDLSRHIEYVSPINNDDKVYIKLRYISHVLRFNPKVIAAFITKHKDSDSHYRYSANVLHEVIQLLPK